MSNSTAGILEAYQVAQTYDYTSVALLSLVAYEFITTVDQEVACVWTRRPSATSVLLVTTRWVMVLYQALQWIPYHTYSACWALEVTDFTLYLVSLAQMAVFSSLRVYALWSRSQLRYLFAVAVLALSCVPIATNIFQLSRIYAVWSGPPIDTCNIVSNISNHLNRSMLLLTRSCALSADVLVLVLTWIETFHHWRQLRQLNMGASVSGLLLRDGTLYFLAFLATNIAQIVTYPHNIQSVESSWARWNTYSAGILQALPSILVQRFMLNLRRFNEPERSAETPSLPRLSQFSVVFRMPSDTLGEIGGPLDHGVSAYTDDDTVPDKSDTHGAPDERSEAVEAASPHSEKA